MSFRPIASVAAASLPILALGYVLTPGHPLAVLRGVPLDVAGVAAAGAVAIAWFGLWRPAANHLTLTVALLVAASIGAKVLFWAAAPTYGLAVEYHTRPRLTGPIERSTEARIGEYTRIEPALDGKLGLHFFNDVERFNSIEESDPNRETLPFAARWTGFLRVPDDGTYPISLTASGAAALFVDDRPVLTVPAGSREETDAADISLARGVVPLRVEYIHAGSVPATLRVAWNPGSGVVPIGGSYVLAAPAPAHVLEIDPMLRRFAVALDIVVLAALVLAGGLAVWRAARVGRRPREIERALLAAFLLAVLIYALVSTRELEGRAVMLEGGQDWLTYESYARDILLNGPLMTLGKPLGGGKPFFFQPFYPYYLAGLHWLAGEALWGPIVIQVLGTGVSGVVLFYLARRLADARAAWATLALFAALFASQLDWVARKLLAENLYFMLLPAAVLCTLRYVDTARRRDLVFGGLLFGLAAVTRAPTLLYVASAAVLLVLFLRRQGATLRHAAFAAGALLALTVLVSALVPLRNAVVSGRPALVATNGGATLLLAHTPTERVRLGGVDRDPLYNALGLDRPTREVAEFVRQDPVGYLATLVPLGLYSLGFPGAVDGSGAVAWDILGLTVLYLVSLVTLPGTLTLRAGLLHTFIAIHLGIMMTFLPYVYGYRQVLPMNLLMLPFAASVLVRLARHWLALPRSVTPDAVLAQQRAD